MNTLNAPEQLAAVNMASIDILHTIARVTLASVERLTTLNLNTARTIVEESLAHARALMGAKDIKELVGLQTSSMQPAAEKSAGYARNVYAIVTQGQKGLTEVVEQQLSELNQHLDAAFDEATKSAPVGSDAAIAAVKSAIAAAQSAYESANKTAKRLVEVAEANMTAATSASTKAIASNATAPKGRKAA
jgi:phasin family protein